VASRPVLAHWRLDHRRGFVRVLGQGALFVTIGSAITGAGLFFRATGGVARWAIPLGVLIVACGPLRAILGMHRLLVEETYLAARADALVWQLGGAPPIELAWDDLVRVSWDGARRAVVVERRAGEPLILPQRFDGVDGPELARRLEQVRKRAALGLAITSV
jgi:hypothetical protein